MIFVESLKWTNLLMAAAAAKLLQLYPTLCDPINSSPPGSASPGILQARTLEWVAISFSSAWKRKVKVKSLSRVQLFAPPWTAAYQAPLSTDGVKLKSELGGYTTIRAKVHIVFLNKSWPFFFFQFKNIHDKEEVCWRINFFLNWQILQYLKDTKVSWSFEESILLPICAEYMKY